MWSNYERRMVVMDGIGGGVGVGIGGEEVMMMEVVMMMVGIGGGISTAII